MLDRVVVTGSHIPQIDSETALPVQVITREEIERLGVTTAAQLLERVPANVNGLNDALSIGNGLTRSGIGQPARTGQRFHPGPAEWPAARQLCVRRFDSRSELDPARGDQPGRDPEDGASAIYGSDAMAGVVNFILRKDYVGAEITAYGALTEGGGGNSGQLIASFGIGDLQRDRYNVFVSATYQRDEALKAIDRDFARTAYRPDLGIDVLTPLTFRPTSAMCRIAAFSIRPTRRDAVRRTAFRSCTRLARRVATTSRRRSTCSRKSSVRARSHAPPGA